MEITEVRIFPKEGQDKKLKAYVTVTFDNAFVVRNIKVIQGSGSLFIAMPSRKVKYPCVKCHFKNDAGSKFCNQCGASLPLMSMSNQVVATEDKSEHRDIAHPITQQFREYLQGKVLEAYKKDASQPDRMKSFSPGITVEEENHN